MHLGSGRQKIGAVSACIILSIGRFDSHTETLLLQTTTNNNDCSTSELIIRFHNLIDEVLRAPRGLVFCVRRWFPMQIMSQTLSMAKATKTQRKIRRTAKERIPRNFDSSHIEGHIVESDPRTLDLAVIMVDSIVTTIGASGANARRPQEKRTTIRLCTMIPTCQTHHRASTWILIRRSARAYSMLWQTTKGHNSGREFMDNPYIHILMLRRDLKESWSA